MGLLTTQSLCFQIAVGKREGTLQSHRGKPGTWDPEANAPPTACPAQPDAEATPASTPGEAAQWAERGSQGTMKGKNQTLSWPPRGFQAQGEKCGHRPERRGQSWEGEARSGEVQRKHGVLLGRLGRASRRRLL